MLLTYFGAGAYFAFGGSASAFLDEEMDGLSPDLSTIVESVEGAVSSGMGLSEAAIVYAGVPILYKILQIIMGYTETHRDGIQRIRDEQSKDRDHERELDKMRLRAELGSE